MIHRAPDLPMFSHGDDRWSGRKGGLIGAERKREEGGKGRGGDRKPPPPKPKAKPHLLVGRRGRGGRGAGSGEASILGLGVHSFRNRSIIFDHIQRKHYLHSKAPYFDHTTL